MGRTEATGADHDRVVARREGVLRPAHRAERLHPLRAGDAQDHCEDHRRGGGVAAREHDRCLSARRAESVPVWVWENDMRR